MRKLLPALVAALLAGTLAALAANTTFVTSIGDLVFPFASPDTNPVAPGSIVNMYVTFNQQPAPTIASGACGAAANGTIAGGSTAQSGLVQIGAAGTTTCAVTFAAALPNAPAGCQLTAANAAAATPVTTVARVSAVSASGFTITGSALAGANYYYLCM